MTEINDDNQQNTLDQAVQQFVDTQLQGRQPDIDEFVKQYPGLEDQIRDKIRNLRKIDTLFDSLVQADESDFEGASAEQDLSGQKIGSFEIVEMIGRGGMGVVYLARDTKLKRSVALKSIPPVLASDSTARTRFRREGELLASLNHPNIGVIHDIIEQTDLTAYLVLEYVPGETLAERIAKEPLKIQEALTIALQIAQAVAAAHEHDVIHRDLKPGNIKITPDGIVKVLDFGLAKEVGGESSEKQTSITQPGRMMGTPAYMSPEQARGKPTDKRSDIWSFGCVLYEMLTGKVPFEGETITDALANILQTDPDLQALPQNTPANILVLLRRCLEKDPHRRLQHIGDASIEINETLNLPVTAPPLRSSPEAIPWSVNPKRLIVWSAACLILVALLASLITWSLTRPDQPPHQPARRFIIHPETNFESEALWHNALAISPDGKRLAYVEEGNDKKRRIYLRRLDEFKARPLPGTESAISPFFSPDGQWVGYSDHFQRNLKKVSVMGDGEPVTLCECPEFRGGSWADDGTIIFASTMFGGLSRISASGEGLEQLTIPDPNQGMQGHVWPQILPGSKAVLFTNRRNNEPDQIEVYSLETHQRCPLPIKGTGYARYISTGHIVYTHKQTLYAVRFDLEHLKTIGSAVPVVSDVMTGGSLSGQFAISRDGTLAYVPVQERSIELRPVGVDRDGQVEPLRGATQGQYIHVRISPDGTQAAFCIIDGSNFNIWIYDLERHTLNPLTSDGSSVFPIWTPDGNQVVFLKTTGSQVFVQNADGSGEPKLLAQFEDWYYYPASYSTDGEEILICGSMLKDPKMDMEISVVVLGQKEQPRLRPFIQRDMHQRDAQWSHDGRWVAYSANETRRWEVYVEPYPGPGPKIPISTDGGYQPVWSKNSNELFYLKRSGDTVTVMAVTFETESEFKVVSSQELFEGRYKTDLFLNYDIAPNGRFLMIQNPREPTTVGINIVLNWFEELKRLVPSQKTP